MSTQCIKIKDFNPAIHTKLSEPSKYGCSFCEDKGCGCIKKKVPCGCWDRVFSVDGGEQVMGIPKSLNISVSCCVKCAGKCCEDGQKCLKDSGGRSVCCDEANQCGNKCCDDGMICRNGQCCHPECCDGCCYCTFTGSWGCGAEAAAACAALGKSLGGVGVIGGGDQSSDNCGCTLYAKIDCGTDCDGAVAGGSVLSYPSTGYCCGGKCSPLPCSSSSASESSSTSGGSIPPVDPCSGNCGCIVWVWVEGSWTLEQPVCAHAGCIQGPAPSRPGTHELESVNVACS